jgi:hypothetical protein
MDWMAMAAASNGLSGIRNHATDGATTFDMRKKSKKILTGVLWASLHTVVRNSW